jgi:hypothetical protein
MWGSQTLAISMEFRSSGTLDVSSFRETCIPASERFRFPPHPCAGYPAPSPFARWMNVGRMCGLYQHGLDTSMHHHPRDCGVILVPSRRSSCSCSSSGCDCLQTSIPSTFSVIAIIFCWDLVLYMQLPPPPVLCVPAHNI